MMLVLFAVAIALVLSMGFLSAQTTTTGIAQNLQNQAVARQIAEAGLTSTLAKVKADANWRTTYSHGTWTSNASFLGGTLTIQGEDGTFNSSTAAVVGDGNFSNNTTDPMTVTAIGRYNGASWIARGQILTTGVAAAPGLNVAYINSGYGLSKVADVNWAQPPGFTTTLTQVNLPKANSSATAYPSGPKDYFGVRFTGTLTVPTAGTWTFYTNSDDGSTLHLNGNLVVNNDGLHGMTTKSGSVALAAGAHDFEARLFEHGGDFGLIAYWQGPGVASQTIIPTSQFNTAFSRGDMFGNTRVFTTATKSADGTQIASRATLPVDGTLKSISVYMDGPPPKTLRVAIYSDVSSQPGKLLAQSANVPSSSNSGHWETIAMPATTLAAGDYWLALSLEHSNMNYYHNNAAGGATRVATNDAVAKGFLADWGASAFSYTRTLSIYATYTPSGAPTGGASGGATVTAAWIEQP